MRVQRALPALVLTLASPLAALSSGTFHHDGFMNIGVRHDGDLDDCSDLQVEAGRRAVETSAEHLTVSASVGELTLASAPRGGIAVKGWNGKDYDLLACKVALGADSADAQARIASVKVAARGGVIESSGPDDEDWLVYWIVRAPRGAAMSLSTDNGPLSVRQAEGNFTIRGHNGPVSLDEVSGVVSVEVENGPVAIANGGGDMQVRTDNGPIAVSLAGDGWEGEGLDARAVNGPLSLEIAEGYRGGVRVESSGNAPWSCGGSCAGSERTWDDDGRQFEIGPRPARVRLSTVNGPVAIDAR